MEAQTYLMKYGYYLILIITSGASLKLSILLFNRMTVTTEGELQQIDKNIKILLKATIVLISISSILTLVKNYY